MRSVSKHMRLLVHLVIRSWIRENRLVYPEYSNILVSIYW